VKAAPRFDLTWILVLLLAVPAVAPLTYPGFFETQGGFLTALNAAHPAEAPNWGRAADPVRGEGKLPYLLAWPFLQLSGSGVTAVKWGYGQAFLLAAAGAYFWTRRWLGPKGGLLAAVVYTYLPWHLSAVYVRGAYAEAWLWALWPVILWAADGLAGRRRWVSALVGLLALGAAFWIQAGLTAVFAVGLLIALASSLTSLRRISRLGWIVLLALAVAIIYLGARSPQPSVDFAGHFVYPFQLLSAAWGFGSSVPDWADGLSFQLGLAAVGLSVMAVILKAAQRPAEVVACATAPESLEESGKTEKGSASWGRAFWAWVVALAAIVLLVLPLAAPVWRVTGLDELLTYPWQLLALAGLPLAFLAGSAIRVDRRLGELPAWAGVTALVILASYPYLVPRFTRVDPGAEPLGVVQPVGTAAPQILLLDAQVAPLPPVAEITPTLAVTLTWQATEPVTGDYTVFVHLLGSDGSKVAQQDARPCDGACPTDAWQPGVVVTDRHTLDLEAGALPGPYRLAIGLYLLDSGERAVVVGRDDDTVFIDVP
jgi:hypothetical protein